MNQRIRQLAEQAAKHYPAIESSGEFWTFDKEKFAELVVRECIGVVNRRYMGDNNREDMEVRRCVEDLKKHFGVE